jgi:hypothetical protein
VFPIAADANFLQQHHNCSSRFAEILSMRGVGRLSAVSAPMAKSRWKFDGT